MDEIYITLERHEQQLKHLKEEVNDLRAVQAEIRAMNETLVTLATELKHTNEHLANHERKIEEIEHQPRQKLQQLATAVISALAGGCISVLLSLLFR